MRADRPDKSFSALDGRKYSRETPSPGRALTFPEWSAAIVGLSQRLKRLGAAIESCSCAYLRPGFPKPRS
jgi:hypothetical protein